MNNHFFSNGKLLLTGEYVVLDGAKAIGIPTKLGQHLYTNIQPSHQSIIKWIAKLSDDSIWFEADINSIDFSIINCSNPEKSKVIASILEALKELNSEVFKLNHIYELETKLDFPTDWGLGSSSTLLVLLSKFANVDAFKFSQNTFGGSGYDISCGLMPKTQFYQLHKNQRKVNFTRIPENIKEHCFFVHLNQKQNSRDGIQQYRNAPQNKSLIKSISDISENIVKAPDLYEFEDLLYVHETLISNHLGIPRVQDNLFHDYKGGIIKSLGAWGGDFVLVTAEDKKNLSYFKKKGFKTILSWDELISD